jgi:LPS O-antigen subunit length determinant protein (WzzB/FepE family)
MAKIRKKNNNPQDNDFDYKKIFNEIKNFKFLIIFFTILGFFLSIIYSERISKPQKVEFQIIPPLKSNYIVFKDPDELKKNLSDIIVDRIINREWKFLDKYSKKYQKKFDNIKIEFKPNKLGKLKFISRFNTDDKNYDKINSEKLLFEFVNLAINVSKEDFKYENIIYYKNKILMHEEALEIAIKSEIQKPIVLKGYLMTGTVVTSNSPDYYKGYDVLRVEIKHLEKRLNVISNFNFPIRILIGSGSMQTNNDSLTLILGGGLLGFFISLLLLSLINMKNRY